ncbi:hypothetical protein TWF506_001180 [Arthrobotrys conoides]|uniref:Cell wall protein SED1 n=1 Tax=Arthrobotrys conoides TaxID=74498 RepID=A0AAN8NXA6_9PEZI
MKFTAVLASFAAVAAVAADYYVSPPPSNGTDYGVPEPSYTTTVVSSYVTYCPYPTTITEGGKEYTVTEATTLTVTNCPCTRTLTCSTTTSTSCPPTKTPVEPSTYVPPPPSYTAPEPTPTYAPPPSYNTTVPPPPVATGAASSMKMASGALVAVFGAAAMLL